MAMSAPATSSQPWDNPLALNSKIPTVVEELERKTLETLARLIQRHDNGEVTDGEVSVALTAMFDVVSGIIPWNTTDLLSEANTISIGKRGVYRFFTKPGKATVLLSWEVGAPIFTVHLDPGKPSWSFKRHDYSNEVVPSKATRIAMEEAAKRLLEAGYNEFKM